MRAERRNHFIDESYDDSSRDGNSVWHLTNSSERTQQLYSNSNSISFTQLSEITQDGPKATHYQIKRDLPRLRLSRNHNSSSYSLPESVKEYNKGKPQQTSKLIVETYYTAE